MRAISVLTIGVLLFVVAVAFPAADSFEDEDSELKKVERSADDPCDPETGCGNDADNQHSRQKRAQPPKKKKGTAKVSAPDKKGNSAAKTDAKALSGGGGGVEGGGTGGKVAALAAADVAVPKRPPKSPSRGTEGTGGDAAKLELPAKPVDKKENTPVKTDAQPLSGGGVEVQGTGKVAAGKLAADKMPPKPEQAEKTGAGVGTGGTGSAKFDLPAKPIVKSHGRQAIDIRPNQERPGNSGAPDKIAAAGGGVGGEGTGYAAIQKGAIDNNSNAEVVRKTRGFILSE
ncbi:brain acid soluble protein 1-like [Neocloeon triangulifer]|uniref:brain acid soluble protein 1-like n=1 Tax=Neocloeon triangulifer TaxID=2078957 RepID=UPI00286EC984|nr:brain acid soluble protein 1-like [Neocloeon triangulifer]